MNKEYFQSQTKAYFAIQSISEYKQAFASGRLNSWFSILIFSNAEGGLLIDDYPLRFDSPTAVFVTPGQHVTFSDDGTSVGYSISFNKEFYCIEFHDNEVSCQGLLFVNNYHVVHFGLDPQQVIVYNNTVKEMISEIETNAPLHDEMLKNLLKNLLIRSNRLFRAQISIGEVDDASIDFARKFSDLVEKHYKNNKQVEYYAGLLNIAPASLAKKLQKYGIESPLKIIKSRVTTEAKRLLMYSGKSVKEIADILGYDDPFYFSRLFTKETGVAPSEYKKIHLKL